MISLFKKRKEFEFTHPEAKTPIVIKAASEDKAWKKMEKRMVELIYGGWAFTYNKAIVDKRMNELTCKAL